MAALQSIRNHPVVLTAVLGFGLLLMIIMFGFDDYNGLFQGDRDTVLSVNGNAISWANYDAARQRKSDFYQTFYNQDVNKAEISRQINNQTYEELKQNAILTAELQNLGISVSNAEINELAQGSHISPVMTQIFGQQAQQIGQYFAQLVSANSFDEVAQQTPWATKSNWTEIEYQIVSTRKMQKFNTLLSLAIQPNKLEAEDAFNSENTEVAFNYVAANAYSVADSLVSVSTNEQKAYYESHKQAFKQNTKTRDINYIAVELHPSDADRAAVLGNLNNISEQFAAGTDIEELVNGNGTVPYIDAHLTTETYRDELKEFVDANEAGAVKEASIYHGDILNLIGEQSGNNESLNEYYYTARIMSKVSAPDSVKIVLTGAPAEKLDSILNSVKKGEMDEQAQWVTELATIGLDNDLRSKIFAAPAKGAKGGETFTQEINGQTAIVKIVERTANVNKAKVAIYAERIVPSSKTRKNTFATLNDFLKDFPTVQQMQDSAIGRGFRMMPYTVASTNYNIGMVDDSRNAVKFVFDGKKGDISEIYENGGYLLVAAITGDIQEGYATLANASVADFVKRDLLPAKQIEYLINTEFGKATDKTLEGYAQATGSDVKSASRVSFNTNSISGLGIEPAVVGAAITAKEGTVVGPIAGKSHAVVLQVTEKKDKGLTYDEASYLAKAKNATAYRSAASQAYNVLQNNAEVVDNRLRFY